MINGKKWYAFFSHTGSEIYNLTRRLNITPDCVVTNKSDITDIHPGLKDLSTEFRYTNNWPKKQDYDFMLDECEDGCIVTLHGWMRIIPKSVCKTHDIYNLHPGLITKYPELKGKDPQDRVDDELHERIEGCRVEIDLHTVRVASSCKRPRHLPEIFHHTELSYL